MARGIVKTFQSYPPFEQLVLIVNAVEKSICLASHPLAEEILLLLKKLLANPEFKKGLQTNWAGFSGQEQFDNQFGEFLKLQKLTQDADTLPPGPGACTLQSALSAFTAFHNLAVEGLAPSDEEETLLQTIHFAALSNSMIIGKEKLERIYEGELSAAEEKTVQTFLSELLTP